jgi:hypothetical protein
MAIWTVKSISDWISLYKTFALSYNQSYKILCVFKNKFFKPIENGIGNWIYTTTYVGLDNCHKICWLVGSSNEFDIRISVGRFKTKMKPTIIRQLAIFCY